MTSSATCSGRAVASAIMVLTPPVSAISGTIGPSLAASARLIRRATSVGAGEGDAGDARVGDERGADVPVTERQMQRGLRHARFMQQLDGLEGDKRRLLGGLGDDRIAGHQRCRDLAGEDGEREIPGRRCRETRRARAGAANSTRRSGHGAAAVAEEHAPLARIVAAEIDRLAQFGDGIVERASALDLDQMDERAALSLKEIGGTLQNRGALFCRRRRPGREACLSCLHHRARTARIELGDLAYDRSRIDR